VRIERGKNWEGKELELGRIRIESFGMETSPLKGSERQKLQRGGEEGVQPRALFRG